MILVAGLAALALADHGGHGDDHYGEHHKKCHYKYKTIYETIYETIYKEKCEHDYKEKCETYYETKYKTEYKKECNTVYDEKCLTDYKTDYKEECHTDYEEKVTIGKFKRFASLFHETNDVVPSPLVSHLLRDKVRDGLQGGMSNCVQERMSRGGLRLPQGDQVRSRPGQEVQERAFPGET